MHLWKRQSTDPVCAECVAGGAWNKSAAWLHALKTQKCGALVGDMPKLLVSAHQDFLTRQSCPGSGQKRSPSPLHL